MLDEPLETILPDGAAAAAPALAPFAELARVTLAREVDADEGRLPEGATGTVVAVFERGAGYAVEFTRPFHSVAMVPADAIRR